MYWPSIDAEDEVFRSGVSESFASIIIVTCVLISGFLMSILYGLLSLNTVDLQVISQCNTDRAKLAQKALIIREHMGQMVATLVFLVTSMHILVILLVSELMGDISSFFVCLAILYLFCHIVPAGFALNQGLEIVATLSKGMQVLMYIVFPISFTFGLILHKYVGVAKSSAESYSPQQLKSLIHTLGKRLVLSGFQVKTICNTIDYERKKVASIMTHIDRVYMLSADRVVDKALAEEILKSGYTRIPVYQGARLRIIGALFVRDLIMEPLTGERTLADLLETNNRNLLQVDEELKIVHLITMFKTGFSHMATVTRGSGVIVGIVTLEDVIEELLDEELIDESDTYANNRSRTVIDRSRVNFSELQKVLSDRPPVPLEMEGDYNDENYAFAKQRRAIWAQARSTSSSLALSRPGIHPVGFREIELHPSTSGNHGPRQLSSDRDGGETSAEFGMLGGPTGGGSGVAGRMGSSSFLYGSDQESDDGYVGNTNDSILRFSQTQFLRYGTESARHGTGTADDLRSVSRGFGREVGEDVAPGGMLSMDWSFGPGGSGSRRSAPSSSASLGERSAEVQPLLPHAH
eukprot:Rmarinus@m.2544